MAAQRQQRTLRRYAQTFDWQRVVWVAATRRFAYRLAAVEHGHFFVQCHLRQQCRGPGSRWVRRPLPWQGRVILVLTSRHHDTNARYCDGKDEWCAPLVVLRQEHSILWQVKKARHRDASSIQRRSTRLAALE